MNFVVALKCAYSTYSPFTFLQSNAFEMCVCLFDSYFSPKNNVPVQCNAVEILSVAICHYSFSPSGLYLRFSTKLFDCVNAIFCMCLRYFLCSFGQLSFINTTVHFVSLFSPKCAFRWFQLNCSWPRFLFLYTDSIPNAINHTSTCNDIQQPFFKLIHFLSLSRHHTSKGFGVRSCERQFGICVFSMQTWYYTVVHCRYIRPLSVSHSFGMHSWPEPIDANDIYHGKYSKKM